MAVAAIGFDGYEKVMSVIVLTIMISVYAHGISATPLSDRYGKSQLSDPPDWGSLTGGQSVPGKMLSDRFCLIDIDRIVLSMIVVLDNFRLRFNRPNRFFVGHRVELSC